MIRTLIVLCGFLSAEVFTQVRLDSPSYSLEKYSGEWSEETAAHLLRRSLFGPRYKQIITATDQGLDQAVDALFAPKPSFKTEPRTYSSREGVAQFGQAWVRSPYPRNNLSRTHVARINSLESWLVQEFLEPTSTIHERMFMFWVNHFGTSEKSGDARISYRFYKLLRESSLANFKKLIKDVTIDPHMLCFLNGKDNRGSRPNDNYARELNELFSIGKAQQVSPVDFGNYTEQDVFAASRILSGYVVDGIRSNTVNVPTSRFVPERHSRDQKQLSHYFNNVEIPTTGAQEYAEYIDVIFSKDNIGIFISAELYRFFVGPVTEQVAAHILPQMNELLKSSNFEIMPVLRTLLKSEHFYDQSVRGAIVKSPLDFMLSIYNSTESIPDFTFEVNYKLAHEVYGFLSDNDMDIYNIPSVAGWEAYYLAPNYSKLWINSIYLTNRIDFVNTRVLGRGFVQDGSSFHPDVLGMVENFSDPYDAARVIDDMCLVLFSRPINQVRKNELKNILTANLPDFEWTLEYRKYKEDISDQGQKKVIIDRLRQTFGAAVKLFNFQIF